jgi:hypothetical protein
MSASPPVSTDGLVERLNARFEHPHPRPMGSLVNPDGPEAADRIEQLTATLADRDATIERMRGQLLDAKGMLQSANAVLAGVTGTESIAIETNIERIDAALDASATGMVK